MDADGEPQVPVADRLGEEVLLASLGMTGQAPVHEAVPVHVVDDGHDHGWAPASSTGPNGSVTSTVSPSSGSTPIGVDAGTDPGVRRASPGVRLASSIVPSVVRSNRRSATPGGCAGRERRPDVTVGRLRLASRGERPVQVAGRTAVPDAPRSPPCGHRLRSLVGGRASSRAGGPGSSAAWRGPGAGRRGRHRCRRSTLAAPWVPACRGSRGPGTSTCCPAAQATASAIGAQIARPDYREQCSGRDVEGWVVHHLVQLHERRGEDPERRGGRHRRSGRRRGRRRTRERRRRARPTVSTRPVWARRRAPVVEARDVSRTSARTTAPTPT